MNPLIIHTEGGGRLAPDCPAADVRTMAQQIMGANHTVIHLHGGLVNNKAGVAMATRLAPYYEAAGLQPVFFAWETGPLETIKNNVGRIAKEKIFLSLLERLLRHVAGKVLLDTPGGKAATAACELPSPVEVKLELKKTAVNEEPFAEEPQESVSELTGAEQQRFALELEGDEKFTMALAEVLAGLNAAPLAGAKGLATEVTPVTTLMSKEVTDELRRTAEQPGGKGLLETAALVVRAGKVLVRIVRRFRKGRDHGIYTTIVEELLRELYIDNLGSLVWGSMKRDAEANFAPPDADGKFGGGWLLLQELSALVSAGGTLPKISVVAHSAGSIFACALLKHMAESHPHIALHKVAFLAAACRCDVFSSVLRAHWSARPLWRDFRSYGLSDEVEKRYWEIPGVYPRSLLYIVSGVAETEKDEEGKEVAAFDMPLAGMQRYFDRKDVYQQDDVKTVRKYLAEAVERRVWANENSGPGRASDAIKHGGLDDTDGPYVLTMKSVVEFLSAT